MFIALISIIVSGPPEIPRMAYPTSIDCYGCEVVHYSQNESRHTFSVLTTNFVEFPLAAAIELFSVEVHSAHTYMQHFRPDFWDVSSDKRILNFSILVPFTGYLNLTVRCHNRTLIELESLVNTLPYYPTEYSSYFTSPDYTARLYKGCMVNSTLLLTFKPFTVAQPAKLSLDYALNSSNSNLPFQYLTPYLSKHPPISEPTLFIASNATTMFDQLMDVIIPAFASAYYVQNFPTNFYFALNQSHLIRNLGPLITGRIIPTEENVCFDQMFLVRHSRATSFVGPVTKYINTSKNGLLEHLSWIHSMHPHVMPILRSFYTSKTAKNPNKIVIDLSAYYIKSIITKNHPQYEVFVIDFGSANDLFEIADMMGDAALFVTCHYTTGIFSFLLPPKSVVYEITPMGLECTNFSSTFAAWSPQTKYFAAYRHEECQCPEFKCVFSPTLRYAEIATESIINVIPALMNQHFAPEEDETSSN